MDLFLASTLSHMIYIYRGDLSLALALDTGALVVHGVAWARRALSRWLVPIPIAHVKWQRSNAKAA